MAQLQKTWDVIVIGAGPAGLSAATVLARCRRSVLIIDEGRQRNLKSQGLHNYLTRDGILPPEFLKIAYKEVRGYNVSFVKARAEKIGRKGGSFTVSDHNGAKYEGKKLLLATGVADDIPAVPGMRELWGSSVFHCPFCDGYECRDLELGLYAKKHNGFAMAVALHHLSARLSLFTDGAFYLKPAQRKELAKRNINVVTRRVSRLIHQDGRLEGIELVTGAVVPCQALFTNHGFMVNHRMLEQLGCRCTRKGAIVTNRYQQTSVAGIYAAGDASVDMHFAVVSAAEGVKAGVAIHNDLLKEGNRDAMKVKDQ